MLEIKLRFLNIFPNFSLFIFFNCLVRFNNNNKRHLLMFMLTRVSILRFPSFNLSIFTEEVGTTINNEDRNEF